MKTFIKIYILFTVLFCDLQNINGQTLHAILFADTKDESIGNYDKQDFINVSTELSTIASASGLKLKTYYHKDEMCSKNNLVSVLSNLSVGKDDVVFFYYSGHGTRATNDASDYPQMCLASHYDKDFYPLEKVLQKLSVLPARLKIVIGDCCNSTSVGVTVKDYATKGATVLSKEPVNAYRNLFNGYRGTIIASGSTKGENSKTVSYKDGRPAGGSFTVMLLATLQATAKNGIDANWEEILEYTKQKTKELSQHTPVFTTNLKSEGNINPNESAPTNNYQAEGDDITMIDLLAALANEQYTAESRVENMNKFLKGLFANPNVVVESVGRNMSTVVSTEKASDFVLRLATAHNLINLVEIDATSDEQGKYTYLRVHEIYKNY